MSEPVYIVSGLPRSGTSMMMRMLEAGGLDALTDQIRAADDDNPAGYFEFERVKQIQRDQAWLPGAHGKVVKMISMLLQHLPPSHDYRVIFMERDMREVLASQAKMLQRRQERGGKADDAAMARLFEKHLADVRAWLGRQPNIKVLYVNYAEAVRAPRETATRLAGFLPRPLNTEAMIGAIDRALYRNQAG